MIFVNYKTYEEGTGQKAVALTKILEDVAHTSQVKIIPVVQIEDIEKIVSVTTLEVWIQYPNPNSYSTGISGVFLNHSAHKINNFDELRELNEKALSANLKTLIFASSLDELKRIVDLNPTFVSYEPPSLIGSTTNSVASAQPEIISQAVEISKNAGIPLIVGAGIHELADVKKSLELGAVGIAVATDILKADDPKKELTDLTEGFK